MGKKSYEILKREKFVCGLTLNRSANHIAV